MSCRLWINSLQIALYENLVWGIWFTQTNVLYLPKNPSYSVEILNLISNQSYDVPLVGGCDPAPLAVRAGWGLWRIRAGGQRCWAGDGVFFVVLVLISTHLHGLLHNQHEKPQAFIYAWIKNSGNITFILHSCSWQMHLVKLIYSAFNLCSQWIKPKTLALLTLLFHLSDGNTLDKTWQRSFRLFFCDIHLKQHQVHSTKRHPMCFFLVKFSHGQTDGLEDLWGSQSFRIRISITTKIRQQLLVHVKCRNFVWFITILSSFHMSRLQSEMKKMIM